MTFPAPGLLARGIYRRLPSKYRKTVGRTYSKLPWSFDRKRERWIRKTYSSFGQESRREIFLSISRFCVINRPIEGYYFEFGSHEAKTMRMAYDTFRYLFDWTYVAFDSFEGLPAISPIDEQAIWQKGKLRTEERDFIELCIKHGIPRDRLITVKGFYEDTLNSETIRRFKPKRAAVAYIDCDLYESTVPVLRFLRHFLQRGTIIVFDDWNCFHGDPERGERRAFSEFLRENPGLRLEPFVSTAEAQSFICLEEPTLEVARRSERASSSDDCTIRTGRSNP